MAADFLPQKANTISLTLWSRTFFARTSGATFLSRIRSIRSHFNAAAGSRHSTRTVASIGYRPSLLRSLHSVAQQRPCNDLPAFPKPGWQAYNSAAEHLRGLGAALAQFDFARVRTPAEMSVSLAVLEATNCSIGAIVRDLDGASAAGPIIELSRDLSHSIQDARDKFASSGL